MRKAANCPVDGVLINENKVRIVAFFVLVFTGVFLVTNYLPLVFFLLYDFLMRAFNFSNYSLLALFADSAIKLFNINTKPTDRAPKQFAAATGTVFIGLILIAALFGLPVLVILVTGVLIAFAFLESFNGFCAGCYVYSILQKLKMITS